MGSSNHAAVDPEVILALNTDKDQKTLNENFKGVGGLAAALGSDCKAGLADEAVEPSRRKYGSNSYTQVPPKSFFSILYEGFKDPVILLLCAAATLSTVIGAAIPEEREEKKWIEGIAIWAAVFLVTLVSAINDYQKDLQFRKLNAQKDVIDIKVVRGGKTVLVKNNEVVVGDILLLDTGDKVIADGLVVESYGLVIDEASLTGESDPIKKNEEDPWCRSGTQVSEGSGKMLVLAVGDNSEWGKTISLVTSSGDEQTPLQEKLAHVAATVGKIGATVAATCFFALLIKWCVINRGFPLHKVNQNGPVQFFLYAVTIVVVAIPEGLPLAVTMALAYSMKKMMADQNFVRVLAACETMGGATAICSDKTGTLTENRMTVTEGWFGGKVFKQAPSAEEVPQDLRASLELNFALNSKAFLIEHSSDLVEFVGNRTECALLMLSRKWGADYKKLREQHQPNVAHMYQFTSAKKMASILLCQTDHYLLLNKGAAEWVLQKCNSVVEASGQVNALTDDKRAQLMDIVVGMASRGLRCICLASRQLPLDDPSRPENYFEDSENLDQQMTAMAIVGIKDPVRVEVPAAVTRCQKAGITVRMVTGDNIHTARHIARECGILTDGGIALEGPDFRTMPIKELLPKLPKLQVLARSSPEDKLTLVSLLKHHGEVVAVTGDGTNDAPALKESDVGLAMGIAGTEVAKEAADIVILDDNFSSIVKSVLWGRSVFSSIRKFLQFQLTVNFVALVVSVVGALVGGRMPLNVLQLLWVNLIMDTLGALALATETPSTKLLDNKPAGRHEALINGKMFKHILAQGFYQMFWMFLFLYGLPRMMPEQYHVTTDEDFLRVASVLFNTFIFAQIFNLINSRRIDDEYNVFEDLYKSHLFLMILAVIVTCQVIIINFLGIVFKVQPLNWQEWLVTVAIGAGAMVWSFLVRLVSRALAGSSSSSQRGSSNKRCWAALTSRLNRINQVKSKQLLAAAAVYDANKLMGVEMSVQEAVTLAREKAANRAQQDEAEGANSQGRLKAWLGRRGEAGTKEERTLSGRTDSAGSMGRPDNKDASRF